MCHYSCLSCSASVLPGYCTACQSTRYLSNGNCLCSSPLFQVQSSTCSDQSSVDSLGQTMASIANVIYYINIGIHLIAITMMVCRAHSIKAKKLIDLIQVGIIIMQVHIHMMQVMALISIYPFRQGEVAQRSLLAMGAFNFNYLDSLFCSPIGSYCNDYYNLVGPAFALLLFIGITIVGYAIVSIYLHKESDVIYIRDGKQSSGKSSDSVTFVEYWLTSYGSIIVIYMDSTIIHTTLAISRVITINNWCLLFLLPYVIIILLAIRFHLSVINSQSQQALRYRNQHIFLYLYDQYYHLNYIDHVFSLKKEKRDKGVQVDNSKDNSKDSNKDNSKDNSKDNNKDSTYYPMSSLLSVELIYKAAMGICAVLAYSYQPNILAYAIIVSLLVWMCYMKSLHVYQRADLLFYLITVVVYVLGLSTYWVSSVFTWVAFTVMCTGTVLIAAYLVLIVYAWRKDREGTMFVNAFKDNIDVVHHSQRDSSSLDELPDADIHKLTKEFNQNKNRMTNHQQNNNNNNPNYQKTYQSVASRKPTKRQLRRMETGGKKRLGKQSESMQMGNELNNSKQFFIGGQNAQTKIVPTQQQNIFSQPSP